MEEEKERWGIMTDFALYPGFPNEEEARDYIQKYNLKGNPRPVKLTAEKELKLGIGRWDKRPVYREFQETEHTYGESGPIGSMLGIDDKSPEELILMLREEQKGRPEKK